MPFSIKRNRAVLLLAAIVVACVHLFGVHAALDSVRSNSDVVSVHTSDVVVAASDNANTPANKGMCHVTSPYDSALRANAPATIDANDKAHTPPSADSNELCYKQDLPRGPTA